MSRVRLLELSLRCFGLSIAALIPVIGLPAALISLYYFASLRLHNGDQWNPAGPYLIAGALLSGLGLFISLVSVGVILYSLALA